MCRNQIITVLQICIFVLVLFSETLVNCRTLEETKLLCYLQCMEDYTTYGWDIYKDHSIEQVEEKCKRGESYRPCEIEGEVVVVH